MSENIDVEKVLDGMPVNFLDRVILGEWDATVIWPPKGEGWYWYRDDRKDVWRVWELFKDHNGDWFASRQCNGGKWIDLEDCQGDWVGPLKVPNIVGDINGDLT